MRSIAISCNNPRLSHVPATDFLSSPAVQLRLKHGEPWSTGMNGNTNDVSHGYNQTDVWIHVILYQHIFILSYKMCIPSLVKIQWIRLLHHQNAPVKLSWVNLGSRCSHGAMVAKGLLRWTNVLKPELCKALRGEAISMLQEAMPMAQWGGIFVNSVGSKWNNGKMQRCWLVWTLVRWCSSFNSSCFVFCSRHCKFDRKRLWRCYFWALDEAGGIFFHMHELFIPNNTDLKYPKCILDESISKSLLDV